MKNSTQIKTNELKSYSIPKDKNVTIWFAWMFNSRSIIERDFLNIIWI